MKMAHKSLGFSRLLNQQACNLLSSGTQASYRFVHSKLVKLFLWLHSLFFFRLVDRSSEYLHVTSLFKGFSFEEFLC
jgi:hypothetical protein